MSSVTVAGPSASTRRPQPVHVHQHLVEAAQLAEVVWLVDGRCEGAPIRAGEGDMGLGGTCEGG